jgi:tetratricopeptide (TPR) repeat protein
LDFARATEWILLRLRRPLIWVYVTVGLALTAAAAHFLQSQFSAGFEKIAELSASVVRDWTCQHGKASIKLSDDKFTILVSRLQGDSNGTKTDEIFTALLGKGGVHLLEICESLQIDARGEYVTGLTKAMERGRDILKERHADLILFGKVVVTDGSLQIWTVNEHGGCDVSLEPVVLKHGAPGEFQSDTKKKLYGAVLKEIAAACRHGDDMNWDLFNKQMRKLTALIPVVLELQEEEQLELSTSYYNGLNLLYNRDGDVAWLEAARSFTGFLLDSKATDTVKLNALFFFGRALFSKGDKTNDNDAFTEGIKVFEHMLPLTSASMPELSVQALVMRAGAYKKRGDDGLAIQDLDEAIRLRSKDPDTLNSLCYQLAIIDRLELALAACNESLNLRPNDPATLDSRGFTYLKLKRPQNAINDYDAVLRLDAKHAYSLYGRGLAHLMQGNRSQGNEDIAAAKVIKTNIADEFARYGVK